MSDNKQIFISIASYRDPELLPTLQDMVKQADNTEHLHIAICWQHDNEGIDYFVNAGMTLLHNEVSGEQERWRFQFHNALIDVLSIHYYLSQGACWARHCSETFYAKEGANKRGNSSRLTQSFHFFMFEPIFSPVNALNQPI